MCVCVCVCRYIGYIIHTRSSESCVCVCVCRYIGISYIQDLLVRAVCVCVQVYRVYHTSWYTKDEGILYTTQILQFSVISI